METLIKSGDLPRLQRFLTATIREFRKGLEGDKLIIGEPVDTLRFFVCPFLEYLGFDLTSNSSWCLPRANSDILAIVSDDYSAGTLIKCYRTCSHLEFSDKRFSFSMAPSKNDFNNTKVWIETNGVTYFFYTKDSTGPVYGFNILKIGVLDLVVMEAMKTRSGDALLKVIEKYL